MTILPPHQNPALIGHEGALAQIKAVYNSGRMPHAWLITGVEGVGKATLAYHMANFVLSGSENPLGAYDPEHPAARLIAAEAHPDLFVLQRPFDEKSGQAKDVIPVENARKIAPFLHMTSTHGGWRVAIIDEAHALNRFGQNAILKVIEEPPPRCLILMTVTTPGALLPTIRSRCRLLPLQPLNEASLRAVLARCGLDIPQDDMEKLVRLSGGSAGFALRIMETESLPLFNELLGLLQKLPDLDMPRVHALADKISRKNDTARFNVLTQLLTNAVRETVRNKALGQEPLSIPLQAPLDRALQLWDKINAIFTQAAESNLDRKLAFVNAMVEMRRSAI